MNEPRSSNSVIPAQPFDFAQGHEPVEWAGIHFNSLPNYFKSRFIVKSAYLVQPVIDEGPGFRGQACPALDAGPRNDTNEYRYGPSFRGSTTESTTYCLFFIGVALWNWQLATRHS